jgi:hypothetical protein
MRDTARYSRWLIYPFRFSPNSPKFWRWLKQPMRRVPVYPFR